MNKLIKILLAFILSCSCIACSRTEEPVKEEKAEEKTDKIKTEKGILNVTITIPSSFVGEEGVTQEELDQEVKEKGFKSATINEDGSVTYVMSKSKQKELLKKMKEDMDGNLNDMIGGESTPNVTDIQVNKDVTEFTVTTTNTELDLGESFSCIALFMYGGLYNSFAGNEDFDVLVTYKNSDSKEVIEKISLREWISNIEESQNENN